MENCFSNCCFNFRFVGQHSECDRINCKGDHIPEFSVYCEKSLGFHCYCLNRHQLSQDFNFLCKSQCSRCNICSEMSHIFTELQDVYFFQPDVTCSATEKPLQPVMWRIFNRNISKNNNCFKIEIAKSIPHVGIATNYSKIC